MVETESEFLRQIKNYLWKLIHITIITWITHWQLQFRNSKPEIDLVVNIWKKRQTQIWRLRWGENSLLREELHYNWQIQR